MCNRCGQSSGGCGCGNVPVYGQNGCGCGAYPVPENDGVALANYGDSYGADAYGSGRRGSHGHGCGCNCSLGCRLTNALRRFLFGGCGCGR